MPVKSGTVKIFLGNLSDAATPQVLRPLFEEFGKVVETDVIKNYGFVHMEDEAEARRAITALNGQDVCGKPMVVELSTGVNKRGVARRGRYSQDLAPGGGGEVRCKIFVGNIHKDTQVDELRDLFAAHGSVVEADIISNYAFVHMDGEDAAQDAIDSLNGHTLHGQEIRVQMSTSSVRQVPGMDKADMCFRCGVQGHWSKDCGRVPAAGVYGVPAAPQEYGAAWGGYAAAAVAGARDRGRYAPYPAYAPPPPAYRRDLYYDPQPRRDPYYEGYYDTYDDYDLYDRRRAAAAALPPMHDPYGPPPRRYAAEEPLYDRRATTTASYRVPPAPRRMY